MHFEKRATGGLQLAACRRCCKRVERFKNALMALCTKWKGIISTVSCQNQHQEAKFILKNSIHCPYFPTFEG